MTHPKSSSPTNTILLLHGTEPTLDAWLEFNGVVDSYDAELLEVIPAEFRDQYEDRLRLNSHYETKFAETAARRNVQRRLEGRG
jgi:hypothetical protein